MQPFREFSAAYHILLVDKARPPRALAKLSARSTRARLRLAKVNESRLSAPPVWNYEQQAGNELKEGEVLTFFSLLGKYTRKISSSLVLVTQSRARMPRPIKASMDDQKCIR